MAAVERDTKKPGPNFGKKFWCCAVGGKDRGGCGFFQWTDPAQQAETEAKRLKQNTPRGPDPILISLMKQVASLEAKVDQILGILSGNLNAQPLSVDEVLGSQQQQAHH